VFLVMYFAPLPLERNQHTMAAILAFVIVYWLSEAIPIPVTAMLGLALAVLFNVPEVGPNADDAPGDIVSGASFGFAMPVSTPQNAVVYGSGMIPITKMVRSGIVFDILGLILIVLLIPVMARLVGFV
jgi:di/tricarboxylate transporter